MFPAYLQVILQSFSEKLEAGINPIGFPQKLLTIKYGAQPPFGFVSGSGSHGDIGLSGYMVGVPGGAG